MEVAVLRPARDDAFWNSLLLRMYACEALCNSLGFDATSNRSHFGAGTAGNKHQHTIDATKGGNLHQHRCPEANKAIVRNLQGGEGRAAAKPCKAMQSRIRSYRRSSRRGNTIMSAAAAAAAAAAGAGQ